MPLSRYRNVKKTSDGDSGQFLESQDFPSAKKLSQIPTIKVRVSSFERLDQLAFKHLGAGEYWWIIALMNDIEWMYGFEEGQILKIPIDVQDVLKLF